MLLYLIFMLPGMAIGLWSHFKLHAAYSKYSAVETAGGRTGAQVAREILDHAGLQNVPVEEVEGRLSDHYDPEKKALFLSPDNFHGTSIAAAGVAAHEAGHALQQQTAHELFEVRMALVPTTSFASSASGLIIGAGFFLSYLHMIDRHHFAILLWVGIILFSAVAVFQLVTLPVEYDASRRAKEQLVNLGLVRENEREGVDKVLDAAALTYVAALVNSVLTLFYYISAASDDRS